MTRDKIFRRDVSRRRVLALMLAGATTMSLAGCNIDWSNVFTGDDDDNDSDNTPPVSETEVPGLNIAVSGFDYTTSFNRLSDNVDVRGPYRARSVDFAARADGDAPDIRPTAAIYYYDATIVAPLIAADPRAGLDLPPAVLVYRDGGQRNTNDNLGDDNDGTSGTPATDNDGPGVDGNPVGTPTIGGTGSTSSNPFGGGTTNNPFGTGTSAGAAPNPGTGTTAGTGTTGMGSTGTAGGLFDGGGVTTNPGGNNGAPTTGAGGTGGSGSNNNAAAQVGIAYNAADYLRARYDLGAATDALDAYEDSLSRLAADVAGQSVSVRGATSGIAEGAGIRRVASDNGFQNTLANLRDAIDDDDDLSLVAEFDHRAAAIAAGTMLTQNNDPATLLVIYAENIVSRLIEGGQTVAVDLPIRLLVSREADGDVNIYHDRPSYLADRHDLNDVDDVTDDLQALFDRLIDRANG